MVMNSAATYLFDTCLFIDYRRTKLPSAGALLESAWSGSIRAGFSVITDYELWLGVRNHTEAREHKILLQLLHRYPFTVTVARQTASLFRQYQPRGLSFTDASLAATALTYNLALCTRNNKHFDFILNLKLYKY